MLPTLNVFLFSSFPWFTCNADDNSTIFDKHCICCTHLLRFMCQAKSSILSSTPTWDPSSVAEVPFKTFPVERLHLGFTSAESVLLTADCKTVWSILVCNSWQNKKNCLDSNHFYSVVDLLSCLLISWSELYVTLLESVFVISYIFFAWT